MVAQQKSVKIVQMVSLPVSFLCLIWASTFVDDVIHGKDEDGTVNYMAHETNKLELFLTHFFVLSSRLIAIALFTVSFKWWITTVLIFHSIAIVICDVSLFYPKGECNVPFASLSAFSFCFHWLRDDLSMRIDNGSSAEKKKRELRKMQMFSNAFFVTENIIMILLFYFSQSPHTWYALPVTVCVGSFALLGATMRVTHFCFLTKESNTVETPAGYQPKRHELVEAYGRSVLNTRLGPQRLSTGINPLPHSPPHWPHSCPLGENCCLKFPSYDTRSAMLSRKFLELRHSM